MQPSTTAFKTNYDTQHINTAIGRVIGEWNLNRYINDITIDGANNESFDSEVFPLRSIIEPNRPDSGIPKAIVNKSNVGSNNRVASKDDLYKYYRSKQESLFLSGNDFRDPINIQVNYGQTYSANKISLAFETSWAMPDSMTVYIKNTSNAWVAVATNPSVNFETGRVNLWYNGSTWTSAENLNFSTKIRGVRVEVRSMNRNNSSLEVIEVSARLERDLTDRLVNFSVETSYAEPDLHLPIGKNAANSATIVFDNSDELLSNSNITSMFYGMVEANVQFEILAGMEVNGQNEYFRQGYFYAESWSASEGSITANCYDYSYYLQNTNIPPVLLEDMTGGQIVRELLERAGINSYKINILSESSPTIFPFFWTEEERTLWDVIGEVCEADQATMYFDKNNNAVYYDRDYLFSSREIDLPVSAVSGAKLPNLISAQEEFRVETNKVTIKYKTLKRNELSGESVDSALWNPEDTVAVRSAPLIRQLDPNSTSMFIQAKEAESWPYSSLVNINGEMLRYNGKVYKVFNENGSSTNYTITSHEQKIKHDEQSGRAARSNTFTGELKGVSHGLFGTKAVTHNLHASDWTGLISPERTPAGPYGRGWNVPGGYAVLGPYQDVGDHFIVARGSQNDFHRTFGTRLKFAPGQKKFELGGLVVFLQPEHKAGYYFEILSTEWTSKHQGFANFRAYKRFANGDRVGLPHNGIPLNIAKDVWYQIDVTRSEEGFWTVAIDGNIVMSFSDLTFGNGRHGVFVRGDAHMEFDYVYATRPSNIPDFNDYKINDRIHGGFINTFNQHVMTNSLPQDSLSFDEFDSIVHEVKEFEIEYSKVPALSSSIYVTNDHAEVFDFEPGYFGAKFKIANTGRSTSIVSGDDTTTIPGEVVSHKMLLYGQVVVEEEERSINILDEESVRQNGVKALEVNSKWIQTEAQAAELNKYFRRNWGQSRDYVTVELYANPRLEIGDLVSLEYPDLDMLPATHKYHVVKNSLNYDGSLKQNLTLLRARV